MNGTSSYELNNFLLYLVVDVKLKLDSLRRFSSYISHSTVGRRHPNVQLSQGTANWRYCAVL